MQSEFPFFSLLSCLQAADSFCRGSPSSFPFTNERQTLTALACVVVLLRTPSKTAVRVPHCRVLTPVQQRAVLRVPFRSRAPEAHPSLYIQALDYQNIALLREAASRAAQGDFSRWEGMAGAAQEIRAGSGSELPTPPRRAGSIFCFIFCFTFCFIFCFIFCFTFCFIFCFIFSHVRCYLSLHAGFVRALPVPTAAGPANTAPGWRSR